eukprot:3614295-Prymnesium_polylepis.1
MPANTDGPPSVAVVQLLSKAGGNELVLHEQEHTVPLAMPALQVRTIPLNVAGEVQLRVTLDGADVRRSPLPLQVAPATADPRQSELAFSGRDGSSMLLRAGEPGAFF